MRYAFLWLLASLGCAPEFAAASSSREVTFQSHGVTLAGSLVLPDGEIVAAVVFVHGSGRQARNLPLAERFAREGVATLVYDKRGAGRSGGEYEEAQSVSEKNIALLADDARAAVDALSGQPRLAGVPIGG